MVGRKSLRNRFVIHSEGDEPLMADRSSLSGLAELRDRNTIIARQLLPFFESQPRVWEAVMFLNHGSHDPKESLAQRFSKWRSQCPKELRPLVTRLATVFAVSL